jgi:hypothetical protein
MDLLRFSMKQAFEDGLSGVPLLWHSRARGEPRGDGHHARNVGDERLSHEGIRLSVIGRVHLFRALETPPTRSLRPPSSHLG